jgi:hypothetical protein
MSDPHLGWFRIEEEAVRLINRSFDKPCDARNAMACYVMLCRKVNLKNGAHVFNDTIGSMARDLNLPYRDAQKALALVETIGLVKIERKKLPGTMGNAPSTYTVVRLSGHDITSEPSDITGEPSRTAPVRELSRTFPKNSPRTTKKSEASPRARFVLPTLAEAKAEAVKNGMPESEGASFIDHHEAKGWIIGRSPMRNWQAAMRTWGKNYLRFNKSENRRELCPGTEPVFVPRPEDVGPAILPGARKAP